jgi:pimeloyl-ACP methyl ester carboxylesterase
MVPYDEFGLFEDNAREVGLPYAGPPAVRRDSVLLGDGRRLSALVWGAGPPEMVLLHGGAQNAHTWDTVALAYGRPLVALDLPSHGHSDAGSDHRLDVTSNAPDVATAIRALAPQARAVVGMSLGGMFTIALWAHAPELIRRMVLVDVTPGVTGPKAKAVTDFVNGPKSFSNFDEILARTIQHNPTRTVSSLRRGILHNAKQLPDGSWVWRYRRFDDQVARPDLSYLWDVIDTVDVPLLLVRGMRPQSVVDDADEAELLRRNPGSRVVRVQDAGHSVQGDQPVELTRILREFAG